MPTQTHLKDMHPPDTTRILRTSKNSIITFVQELSVSGLRDKNNLQAHFILHLCAPASVVSALGISTLGRTGDRPVGHVPGLAASIFAAVCRAFSSDDGGSGGETTVPSVLVGVAPESGFQKWAHRRITLHHVWVCHRRLG